MSSRKAAIVFLIAIPTSLLIAYSLYISLNMMNPLQLIQLKEFGIKALGVVSG